MKGKSKMQQLAAALVSGGLLLSQTSLLPGRAAESDMPDFSVIGAVGTLTAAQSKACAESIYTALQNHESSAKLSTSSGKRIQAGTAEMESVMDVYATVVGGWDAGILAIKNQITTTMASSTRYGSYIYSINFQYLVDDKSYASALKDMNSRLDAISAQVQDDWSPVEKALFLHDYLAVHYNYDYTEYETSDEEYYCHTAYNLLKTGKGVCEAYAWLYNVLLEREGIESFMITSDSLLHAWNLVALDNGWVHVDVTWDDVYQEHAGILLHDCFLKGHDAITAANHSSTDWKLSTGTPESELDVTDYYDNGFWSDSRAAIQPYQDGWLAIVPDQNTPAIGWFNYSVYDATTNTAETEQLLSLCEYWTVPGSTRYYVSNYIVPAVYNGVLYYSTPTSILTLADGEAQWVFDLPAEQAKSYRIYGMYIDGDTLYYDLSDAPTDAEVTEYSISLRSIAAETTQSTTSTTTATTTTATTAKPTTSTTATTTTTTESTTSTTATTTTTAKPTTSTTTTTTAKPTTSTTTTTTAKPTTSTTTTTTAKPTTSTTTTTTTKPTTSTTMTTTSSATTLSTTTTAATTTTEATTTTAATTPPPTEPEQVSGDLDGDGELTVSDIITMKRYLLGLETLPRESLQYVDLCPDGVIDIYDLGMMKYTLLHS